MLEFRFNVPNPMIRNAVTFVDAAIDQENKRIHLLDLDADTSLTNAIDSRFQQYVLEHIGRVGDFDPGKPNQWIWFLYHTDNVVSIYQNDGFTFVPLDNPQLHLEFVEVLKDR